MTTVNYIEELRDRMSGSLVALYKKTHEEKYNAEYIRRLISIGFSEEQAHNMFMFELMILKHDHIEPLTDAEYIYSSVIDPKKSPLTEEDSWYVEHQWFLLVRGENP